SPGGRRHPRGRAQRDALVGDGRAAARGMPGGSVGPAGRRGGARPAAAAGARADGRALVLYGLRGEGRAAVHAVLALRGRAPVGRGGDRYSARAIPITPSTKTQTTSARQTRPTVLSRNGPSALSPTPSSGRGCTPSISCTGMPRRTPIAPPPAASTTPASGSA